MPTTPAPGCTPSSPMPHPDAVIVHGKARFSVLTSRLVRIEYALDGVFEDRLSLAVCNRRTPPCRCTRSVFGATLTLKTAHLQISYVNDGKPLSRHNLAVRLGNGTLWRPGMKDPANLHGTIRTLDQMNGNRLINEHGERDIALPHGLLSRSGWALVDDSATPVLDVKPDGLQWAASRNRGARTDWYFLGHGHDYRGALSEAQLIFGRQPLPPRYTLGYWWSRYWAYSDQELKMLVADLDRMGVPLDVLVVDMDWHMHGWTGYTWDRNYFPDSKGFMQWVKKQSLKLTLNLHPAEGVGAHEDAFEPMAKALRVNAAKADRIPFDCVDTGFMDAYFKHLHHPHEDAGVDFWWMDWQQGHGCKLPGLDPLPWLNRLHWEDQQKRDTAKRPLIFSRFGGIGSGRYPVGFSGDTWMSWKSLAYQPHFTATAANVLYGYWSHDIGGHMCAKPERQLYMRWVQYGCYSPILRTHATKDPENDRRFWLFGEPHSSIMIGAVRKRYEMVPYIYTENRVAVDTGVSLCHPMYYENPDVDAAYECPSQYYFGRHKIVAPVVAPIDEGDDMAAREFWLPKGRWIDTALGSELAGGAHTRRYSVAEVPVFVAQGSVIVGQKTVPRLLPGSYKHLVVTAYAGPRGAYDLYEDDGVSQAYESGQSAWLRFEQRGSATRRTVVLKPATGTYAGFQARRSVEIRLPGALPPRRVSVNGKSAAFETTGARPSWHYDGSEMCVVVTLPSVDVRKRFSVTLTLDVRRPGCNGVKGCLARLWAALEVSHGLNMLEERTIAGLAQTGNRVAADPSTCVIELKELRTGIRALEKHLSGLIVTTRTKTPKETRRIALLTKVRAIVVEAGRVLA